MRLLELFDHVYVLNLPERRDRRKQVTRELARLGDGHVPDHVRFLAADKPKTPGGFPCCGARGCFESHLLALEEAQRARAERLLVLEDDFACTPLLLQRESQLTSLLRDSDWDIVWLGHDLHFPPRDAPTLGIPDETWGLSHCYAVRDRCLDDLIAFLEALRGREAGDPRGGPMHYDGALATYRAQRPSGRFFVVAPSVAAQRESRSDISPSRYDRHPSLRPLATLAHGTRHALHALSARLHVTQS